MMTKSLQTITAVLLGSVVCACATYQPQVNYERLVQVVPGHTKDDVLRIAGRPGYTTRAARNGELWIYRMPNAWDGRVEYDITFDAKGVVTATRSQQDEG